MVCDSKLKGRQERYCSTECKNKFHRDGNAPGGKTIKRITKKLHTNRQVLKEFLGERSTATITRAKLAALGYDDTYLTHIKDISGRRYFFTFDYGFRDDGEELKVVKAFNRD